MTADALILTRRNPAPAVLVQHAPAGTAYLNAGDFDFGFQGGVALALARHFGERNAVEIRYLGVDAWRSSLSSATPQLTAHLAVHGGYRLLWLDGVALAPDQVAVSDFVFNSGLATGGTACYHGAFVGLELSH